MQCSLEELFDRFSSNELTEWLAYDRVECLPDPWWQTGLTIANARAVAGVKDGLSPLDHIPGQHAAVKRNEMITNRNLEIARTRLAGFVATDPPPPKPEEDTL